MKFNKKHIFLHILIFLIFTTKITSQNINNKVFEKKILEIKASENKKELSKNHRKGMYILNDVFYKNSFKKFNYIDYWNISIALSYLNKDKELIYYSINKAYKLDSTGVYSLLKYIEKSDYKKYEELLNKFAVIKNNILEQDEIQNTKNINKFNVKEFYNKNDLDIELIKLIRSINYADQKYRKQDYKKNLTKQNKLDSLNLSKIDSLYQKYNTYIGKSLVGEKYSHVMWLVIQHSNIKKMEEYLPVLIEAVKNKELKLNPLKMLIDRIYAVKHGYQIFGSQMGVDIANDGYFGSFYATDFGGTMPVFSV